MRKRLILLSLALSCLYWIVPLSADYTFEKFPLYSSRFNLSASWCCTDTHTFLALGGGDPFGGGGLTAQVLSYNETTQQFDDVTLPTITVDSYVNSCAWCCTDTHTFLALGGDGSSKAQVLSYNETTQQFEDVTLPAVTVDSWVNSCAWCCTDTHTFLALGGYGGSRAQLLSYNETTQQFEDVTLPAVTVDGEVFSCAWCCTDTHTFLALGGRGGSTAQVLSYNETTQQFEDVTLPTIMVDGDVWSCAWCCTDTHTFLALGGRGSSKAQVLSYNETTQQFDDVTLPAIKVNSFVNSCAWCCTDTHTFLALGGYGSSKAQVLSYNETTQQFEDVTLPAIKVNSQVWSCAWCCTDTHTFLALGGYVSSKAQVLSYNETTQQFEDVTLPAIKVNSQVRSCAWCCTDTHTFLALGGDGSSTAQVLSYNETTQQFEDVTLPTIAVDGYVRSCAWCCTDTHTFLALGGEGGSRAQLLSYNETTQQFEDVTLPAVTVNSLVNSCAWCCTDTHTFLALGGEGSSTANLFRAAGETCRFDISPEPDQCKGQRNVTLTATGGSGSYEYSTDGGVLYKPLPGSQYTITLTNPPHSAYTIIVRDAAPGSPDSCTSDPVTVTVCGTTTSCLPPNKLFLTEKYDHGAPIQSVAWSCSTDSSLTLAAIGGYKAVGQDCAAASARVYTLDTTCGKLNEIFTAMPTDYVFAVDWCTINGIPYLAVAGYPSKEDKKSYNVRIYKYDEQYGMVPVAQFAARNDCIYTIKWLCDECDPYATRTLAIGGQSGQIRLLQFDAASPGLHEIGSTSFGATVYTLDWCKGNDCLYLAAGGTTADDCQTPVNLRIYAVTCDGCMTQHAATYYEGGTVRKLAWCCQPDVFCRNLMYLAVGGDPIPAGSFAGKNVLVYYYNPMTQLLRPFAGTSQPDKVFAVDWLTGCKCTYLIVGSGCLTDGDCLPNIGIYNIDKKLLPELGVITNKHFDDNIASLATCKIGDITYLLAGSESNNRQADKVDPLCPKPAYGKELALYKGIFCQKSAVATCKPTGICDRAHYALGE